jgi:hypothetical protein
VSAHDDEVHGGRFYGRLTPNGPFVPVVEVVGEPDAWICRRVVDFPGQQIPAGGDVAACSRCEAPIVFNPLRTVTAPKICMQCASIRPLPIED